MGKKRYSMQICLLGMMLLMAFPNWMRAQFTYATNDDNTITITGYSEFITDAVIPETIDGLPVTGISHLDFVAAAYLNSLSIPASVTNISADAFSNIGATISVDVNNPAYSSQAGVLFNKDQTILIYCPGRTSGSYVIPDTVTNIGDSAFYYCENLTNITIPNGVVRIGNSAFVACSLTGIEIPGSVSSIGTNVFLTSSLTAITVDGSNSVYSSLAGVLFDHNQTVLIRCPPGETGGYTIPVTVTNIADSAFFSCAITNITIPTNVTVLGDNAFGSCPYLTSIAVPGSVSSISSSDFFFCGGLTNITLPNTITNIGDSAFFGCNNINLTEIAIPDSVVNIGNSAFGFCTGLTNLVIPEGVNYIGSNAFSECFSLVNVTLPGGITRIADGTFSSCYNLRGVTIPGSVTNIGNEAFFFCSGLTSITIPTGVTYIGSNAFNNCQSLTSVIIPSNVTMINDQTFYGCYFLNQIYFEGDAPSIGSDVFADVYDATVFYLSGTTGWGGTFGGFPTTIWFPEAQTTDASFGVQTNQFGFNINWARGQTLVVEAGTNLVEWQPVQTNTFTSNTVYFSDSKWASYPSRFYRLRSP